MAVPERNANVVALFPLQETIWDKDGTGALASGVVSFFSDPGFSVPKDVYQETADPVSGVVTYTNLGSVLILSGIGSFVDGNGANFIPLLYPYEGTPDDSVVGEFQPYYITVYSSAGIFQFSTNDWPPNSFSQSGSSGAQEALTPNLITNPQFSIVSFTPDPTTGVHAYSVSGTESNSLAPGWTLDTVGTAVITVSQVSLSTTIDSESPYALSIAWTTGLTSLKIVQQLTNSPRVLAGGYASASLVVDSPTGDTVAIEVHYVAPAPNAVDETLIDESVSESNTYTTINGTRLIPATNTQSSTGYVNFVIQINSITSASSAQITSAQLVGVSALSITPPYIQQTTQQNLNNLMWYYEPQLAFKPIPSYTIGWDFPYNPCQELGPTIGVNGVAVNNKSFYIADQTICFESVGNTMSFTVTQPGGLTIDAGADTSCAIIQYLDGQTARELLAGRMSVEIKGYTINGSQTSINGNVSLWWTQDSSLPDMTAATYESLVSAVSSAGVVTCANGTWTEVPRGNLGTAWFTFNQAVTNDTIFNQQGESFSFSGWDATATSTPQLNATFFAIVIGFATITAGSNPVIRYCSLNAGDIATPPPAMNEAQTLQALQYYYESSYNPGIPVGTAAAAGSYTATMVGYTNGGSTTWGAAPFGIRYNTTKRLAPTVTFYTPGAGLIDNVTAAVYVSGASVSSANAPISGVGTIWSPSAAGTRGVIYDSINNTPATTFAATTAPQSGNITYHYVADARLGVV